VRQIEYHCDTALVVTLSLPAGTMLPQQVDVVASNDGGTHFGPSLAFTFYQKFDELPQVIVRIEKIL
jgi:hypothetical protein